MKNSKLLKLMGEEKERQGELAVRNQLSASAMAGRRGNTPLHRTRRFGRH